MNDMLETQLRETLAARAEEVPESAVGRVRGHDYRPRTRDLRPPIAGGAVACAAVAGGLVVGLGLSHPSAAFAGWKAHPTAAKPDEVASAGSSCQTKLQGMSGSAADSAASAQAGRPPLPSLSSMSQVLSDTRGPFTFLIYANPAGTASAACFDAPGFTSLNETAAIGSATPVATDGVSVVRQSQATSQGNGYTFIEGQVGSGVSQVTLDLKDGSTVQATIQNGWFAAWWPGSADATAASLTTPSGTTTATLPAPDMPGCPVTPGAGPNGNCTANSSAGSAGGASIGIQSAGGQAAGGPTTQCAPMFPTPAAAGSEAQQFGVGRPPGFTRRAFGAVAAAVQGVPIVSVVERLCEW
jgi:hypothetical protein